MKTKLIVLVLMFIGFLGCKDSQEPEVIFVNTTENSEDISELDPNAQYAKAEFGIDGMTCAMGCAKNIEKKLAKMEGVKSAKVDFDNRMAMVVYNEAKVSPNSLEEAVALAGKEYSVKDMKTVESFTNEKKVCSMACCEGKTAEEKANCPKDCCSDGSKMHDKDGKMTCAEDCKKACCAEKA